MKSTRHENFDHNIAEEMDESEFVTLTVGFYISPEQYEQEKETRTLQQALGSLGKIERTEDSWRTLSAKHNRRRNGEVFLGRSVVEEFRKNDGGSNFVVNVEEIDKVCSQPGIEMKGEEVDAEFWIQMSQ